MIAAVLFKEESKDTGNRAYFLFHGTPSTILHVRHMALRNHNYYQIA